MTFTSNIMEEETITFWFLYHFGNLFFFFFSWMEASPIFGISSESSEGVLWGKAVGSIFICYSWCTVGPIHMQILIRSYHVSVCSLEDLLASVGMSFWRSCYSDGAHLPSPCTSLHLLLSILLRFALIACKFLVLLSNPSFESLISVIMLLISKALFNYLKMTF